MRSARDSRTALNSRAVPRVVFPPHLARWIAARDSDVPGSTVREALDAVFTAQPKLESYVLDDQRSVRQHVLVSVDGKFLKDRTRLTDAVAPGSVIHVLPALSGG